MRTTIRTAWFDDYAWQGMRTWRTVAFKAYQSHREDDLESMQRMRFGTDKSSSSPTENILRKGRLPLARIYLRY